MDCTIFLADDHQLFIDGLSTIISDLDDFFIIGTAQNGKDALAKIMELNPDIVLLDINMPGMDGIEICEKLKSSHPDIKVIIVSMLQEYIVIQNLISLGIDGFINKNSDKNELIAGLHKVKSGEKYFGAEIRDIYFNYHLNNQSQQLLITRREKDVLKLITKGLSTIEIGEQLNIGKSTVETHRKHLMSKLKVKNVAEMVRVAIESKLI